MKSTDPHIRTLHWDGEEVFFPDEVGWVELGRDFTIDDHSLTSPSLLKWTWDRLEYIAKHPEFVLGLRQRQKPGPNSLNPIVFLVLGSRFERVHLEFARCGTCEWSGTAATPIVVDLYLGLPNRQELLKSTYLLPEAPCPRCGTQLPGYRHYIWTEPVKPNEPGESPT